MQPDYVQMLKTEYLQRRTANVRYSERAFAQAVGLSPGFLKLLFQKKRNLGVTRAHEIVSRLNWSQPKRFDFMLSVRGRQLSKSPRSDAKQKIEEADFCEIADWYYFAIVEFVKLKSGIVTIDQIAKCFGIKNTEAQYAFDNLIRLGIVEQIEGRKYRVPEAYEVPSVSSEGIRLHHQQMFQMAAKAIFEQSIDQRELRGLTLSFDSNQLVEAKKEIRKFMTQFEKKFSGGISDSVYQLSLALFQLDRGNK